MLLIGFNFFSMSLPSKRVRVSDINITRYQEEFLEIGEIASGEFGTVKQVGADINFPGLNSLIAFIIKRT